VNRDHTGIIRELVEKREVTRRAGETEVSTTVRRIKVADPLPALETLAKIHGLEKPDGRPGRGPMFSAECRGTPAVR
jgi:hypothetical protein